MNKVNRLFPEFTREKGFIIKMSNHKPKNRSAVKTVKRQKKRTLFFK